MEGEQTDQNVAFKYTSLPRHIKGALLCEVGETLVASRGTLVARGFDQGKAESLPNTHLIGYKSGLSHLDRYPRRKETNQGSRGGRRTLIPSPLVTSQVGETG